MELYVLAKANEYKLRWSAEDYINKAKKYNIVCKIKDMDLGLVTDKYKLKLKGEEEDIKSFISYLRHKGFKIKEF